MEHKIKTYFILLLLVVSGTSLSHARDVITVYPQEYPDALSNPLKGFRPDPGRAKNPEYPYPTLVRDYIRWNEIENDASDDVQKIIDFCNEEWKDLEKYNIKVIPRIYLDWDKNVGNEYWPADLTNGDWTSDEFKERVVNLVYKLGQAWDKDPRVAWVQTGIIGYWGEQENPVGIDEDGWDKRLGDAFTNAFPNKKLVVRNQNDWPDYEMGVYWDSFGHPGQRPWAWTNIKNFNNQGRYLTQIVEGEVAYNWGEDMFDPVYGGEPEITLNSSEYTDNLIDVIRELHCTALGWIASYDLDGSHGSNPDSVEANAARVQKEFGYRFVIPEFSCAPRVDQGGLLDINFKVENAGSAPFYEKWPLAFVLVDASSQEIVWTEILPDVDVTTWLPGHNYDYDSRTYETPAEQYSVNAGVTIPGSIPSGQYMAGITILEPYSNTPGVFFAMKNFIKQSQAQPLAMIGIGADVDGGHEINPAIFDDPVNDDNRSYTLEWNGAMVQLTTSAAPGGTASPGSAEIPLNQKVWLKAEAQVGYEFSHWSGDCSGTENPVKITMDSDKSVMAHFITVPTHTLTIEAGHGQVALNPSGGVYNEGTRVMVQVEPDLGYVFTEWIGDLTGADNPTSITMDADKKVTAVFDSAPVYTLETSASGGTVTLEPKGPQYTAGTVVTVKAVAKKGFLFAGWSGDPLDLDADKNPNQITMDSDKSITAEFVTNQDDFTIMKNGDFSEGLDWWSPLIISPAEATISVVDGECKIAVDAVSDQDWHVNLMQPGLQLESNQQYTLSFDARASSEKTIETHAQFDHGPWTASLTQDVTLSTTMQRHSVTWFQTTDATTYKVGFFFGADTSDVWLDNVKLEFGTHVENETNTSLPQNVKLFQNYPNPFNPETTIPYQLDRASYVKLDICNILGQHVITLVNEPRSAGYHSVQWYGNGKDGIIMPSGVYIYRLAINSHIIQTKKIVLTK